jgi:uncharacterized repeat protein (TIGR02543 family)
LSEEDGAVDISSLLTPNTDSQVFVGWYTDEKLETPYTPAAVTAEKGDFTLYAKYDTQVTLKFDGNGATNDEYKTAIEFKVNPGSSFSAKAEVTPEPYIDDNHTFVGWYEKDDNGVFGDKITDPLENVTENKTYYAQWDNSENEDATNILTFDVNKPAGAAAEPTAPSPASVKYVPKSDSVDGDSMQTAYGALPTEPTLEGYTFEGWYNNKSGDGEKLELTDIISTYLGTNEKDNSGTVYARWKSTDTETGVVKVVFNKTGDKYGDGTYKYGTIADKYVTLGSTIGDAMPLDSDMITEGNKNFMGWYTQADGKGDKVVSTTAINTDLDGYTVNANTGDDYTATVTLYPYWAEDVTLTFVKNGGEDPTDASPATPTQPLTITPGGTINSALDSDNQWTALPTVTKSGYKFIGWQYATTTDGGTTYTPVTEDGKAKMLSLDDTFSANTYVVAAWETQIIVSFETDDPQIVEPSEAIDPVKMTEYPLVYQIWDTESYVKGEDGQDTTTQAYTTVTEAPIASLDSYTYTYTKKSDAEGTEDTTGLTTVKEVGEYTAVMVWNTAAASADPFTTYTVGVSPIFEIVSKDVDLKIAGSDYYAYADNLPENAVSTIDDSNVPGYELNLVSKVTGEDGAEIDVPDAVVFNSKNLAENYYKTVFTKSDDNSVTFTDEYPNVYGEYTVQLLERTGDDAGAYTINWADSKYELTFHLYPQTATVNVSIGDGDKTAEGATDKIFTYTVTMHKFTTGEDSAVTDGGVATYGTDLGTNVYATIASSGKIDDTAKTTMPEVGTDFTAPANKKLAETDPWLEADDTYTPKDPSVAFTANTKITPSYTVTTEYVVANYEEDVVTVTFKDTKETDAAADIEYTLTAGGTIAGGAKYDTNDVTELPTMAAPSDSMELAGWYSRAITSADITAEGKTVSDLTKAMLDELVKAENSTLTQFTASDTVSENTEVYAVYVLKSDATLSDDQDLALVIKEAATAETTDGNDIALTPTFAPKAENGEYEGTVDKDSDYAYIKLTPADKTSTITATITSTVDGTETTVDVTVTPVDDGNGTVTLVPALAPAESGASNDIVVTVTAPDGTTNTYTFKLTRKVEAKINLNYGNSPAGRVMRDDVTYPTLKDKLDGIQTFNLSDTQNKKFAADKSPIIRTETDGSVTRLQTSRPYTVAAWNSYKDEDGNQINYDLDTEALFVYEGNIFTDPGYTVTDEYGNQVKDAVVTVSGSINKQGVGAYSSNVTPLDLSTIKSDDDYSLYGIIIRPDVYNMHYTCSYTDASSGETVTVEADRPLIILAIVGDVQYTTIPTVSTNDANYIRSNYSAMDSLQICNSLVSFRSADVSYTAITTISTNDANLVRSNYSALDSDKDGQFYPEIE